MGPLLALLEPLRVLLEHLSGSLGRPPGDLLGGLLGVPKPTLKHPQSWRANYSENWVPASTGARFSKPVRARTGSELQRERILSLGIKKELGRESEKTRREAKEKTTMRYLIPSFTRTWRHDSKRA